MTRIFSFAFKEDSILEKVIEEEDESMQSHQRIGDYVCVKQVPEAPIDARVDHRHRGDDEEGHDGETISC